MTVYRMQILRLAWHVLHSTAAVGERGLLETDSILHLSAPGIVFPLFCYPSAEESVT